MVDYENAEMKTPEGKITTSSKLTHDVTQVSNQTDLTLADE